VDDFLVTAVCRRTARLLAPDLPGVMTPTVWCGLADHHVAFGGTFSLGLATYYALLHDLCGSILKAGFGKIVLVNGHAGNIAALATIAGELTRELDAPIATATYFMVAAREIAGLLEDQGGLMHACEAETSMMMAEAPERRCCMDQGYGRSCPSPVRGQAMRTEIGRPSSSIRLRAWTATATSVVRCSSVRERSPSPITCLNLPMAASTCARFV